MFEPRYERWTEADPPTYPCSSIPIDREEWPDWGYCPTCDSYPCRRCEDFCGGACHHTQEEPMSTQTLTERQALIRDYLRIGRDAQEAQALHAGLLAQGKALYDRLCAQGCPFCEESTIGTVGVVVCDRCIEAVCERCITSIPPTVRVCKRCADSIAAEVLAKKQEALNG